MARLPTLLLAFGALGSAYAAGLNARDTVSTAAIDLGYAQYQGILDTSRNYSYFLGMRYANPPTGEYRWQAPQAPSNVTGVQQATSYPPTCLQGNSGAADTDPFTNTTTQKRQNDGSSEDCLFLHVLTPGIVSAINGLPVIVWIHGGGYVAGAATEPTADLISDSLGSVVVVQIQYRLGAFGFLAGEQVKANGALNAGLLDQTFALQWVQQHIASFGGDPSKVTIWGESAGAGSVLQHVVANGGQTQPPLFRAAMTSSTFFPSQYNYSDPIPTALYDNFASAAGCGTVSDSLSCLRAVDASTLENLNLQMSSAAFYGTYTFVPVVDGTFIVERPTVTLNNKKFNGVRSILAVTNTNEGANFMSADASTSNTTEYIRELFPELPATLVDQASNQYTKLTSLYPTSYAQSTLVMTEAIFVCPSYYLLQAIGNKAYKGEFAIPPANHYDDSHYYFTSTNPPFNNMVFIQSFSQSFINVIISDSPNVKFDPTNQTPQWNPWTPGQVEMLFNMTAAGEPDIRRITTDPGLLERCAFWNSVGQYTGQ